MESVEHMPPVLFLIMFILLILGIYILCKIDHKIIGGSVCAGAAFFIIIDSIPYLIESSEGAGHVNFDGMETEVVVNWIFIVVACVCIIYSLKDTVCKSFVDFKNGIKNNYSIKQNSLFLKKESKKVNKLIIKLNKIRGLNINKEATNRAYKVCNLISLISGGKNDKCFYAINERYKKLNQSEEIEHRISELAEKYKNIGNADKCIHYLNIIDGNKTEEVNLLRKECRTILNTRNEEKRLIKKWVVTIVCLSAILICSMTLAISNNIKENRPYKELEQHINDRTLSESMSESEFKDILDTQKGHRLIKKHLEQFHNENDVESALWLFCELPGRYFNELDICVSYNFADWIVDYAKQRGTKSSETFPSGDSIDVYYCGKYDIGIDLIYDITHEFSIRKSHRTGWEYIDSSWYKDDIKEILIVQ